MDLTYNQKKKKDRVFGLAFFPPPKKVVVKSRNFHISLCSIIKKTQNVKKVDVKSLTISYIDLSPKTCKTAFSAIFLSIRNEFPKIFKSNNQHYCINLENQNFLSKVKAHLS